MKSGLFFTAFLFLVVNLALVTRLPAAVLYVDLNSPHPAPPYADWSTAATNIQDAVDAAQAGDTVLVTNGVYATGGRNWAGSGTNRVTLTNAITLQSVNGPAVTQIVGNRVSPVSANAVRCVAIGSKAVLSGFTLTNGMAGIGNYPSGGGVAQVQSLSAAGTVTNCVLVNNLATNSVGGGAYRVNLLACQLLGNAALLGGGACACTLANCTLASNTASSAGGGVYGASAYGASLLTNCTLTGNAAAGAGGGGGAYGASLFHCVVANNTATNNGGGAYSCAMNNCLVVGNQAFGGVAGGGAGGGASGGGLTNCVVCNNTASLGGGLYAASATDCLIVSNTAPTGGGVAAGGSGQTLLNCTVVGNTASSSGGGVSGGSGAWLYNCIIYYNSAPTGSNIIGAKYYYSCTTAPLLEAGDIADEPAFVNPAAGDFHLQSNSPCINSGNNADATVPTDLDGNPRIAGGTVDIGAYEFPNPSSVLSYAWAQSYGLPTDGSADDADPDGDGMSNFAEWIAGTDPTNPASVLRMLSPANQGPGVVVVWQSVAHRTYYLQRASDLGARPAFSTVQSNLVGSAGTTSYTDTTATNPVPYFYRVGVQ